MEYDIAFMPQARRDLAELPRWDAQRVLERIERMRTDLAGDVRQLTNFFPRYRLRVGDYRVLFNVESGRIDVYRVLNRRDAYD